MNGKRFDWAAILCVLVGLGFAWSTIAQESAKASRMDISADTMTITKDRAMTYSGTVRATIYNEGEPAPMRIQADEVYVAPPPKEGGQPDKVDLKGNVVVQSGEGSIRSRTAVLNLATGAAVFTDDVVGSTKEISQFSGDKATYNLKTGEISISRLKATGISIGKSGPGADTGPSGDTWLLSAEDITDWPAFLKAIAQPGDSSTPTPAGQMRSLLKQEQLQGLSSLPSDQAPNAQAQRMVVKILNGLLQQKGFYSEAAWKKVSLDDVTKGLVAKRSDDMTAAEVAQRNRLLLQAAFPQSIRAKKP